MFAPFVAVYSLGPNSEAESRIQSGGNHVSCHRDGVSGAVVTGISGFSCNVRCEIHLLVIAVILLVMHFVTGAWREGLGVDNDLHFRRNSPNARCVRNFYRGICGALRHPDGVRCRGLGSVLVRDGLAGANALSGRQDRVAETPGFCPFRGTWWKLTRPRPALGFCAVR